MRILITGGAGFIGSNLARKLLTSTTNHEVVVLDDLSSGYLENLEGLNVEMIEGSILDLPLLQKVSSGVDSIVHLAARASVPRSIASPRQTHDVNVTGTLNVLEVAREIGAHVISASSSSVYGSNPQLPKVESMATRPMSPYAASKLATETYTLSWGNSYNLDVLAFRFFNVYGPGQRASHAYAAVIPAFFDSALHNRPFQIHGDGSQTRDFTYIDTVCGVINDALARRVSNQNPVNLALGTRTSVVKLAERIAELMGINVNIETLPTRVGDVPHSSADSKQLLTLFPNVEVHSLEAGLSATLGWMRTRT